MKDSSDSNRTVSGMHGHSDARRGWLTSFLQRLLPRRGKLLGGTVLVAAMSVAQAQNAVPEHWISYATMTGNHLQARLSEGSGDLVTRLHGWLEQSQLRSGDDSSVVVRIWIAPDGEISRSEFDSLGDAQADADLRAILAAQAVPEPPPADMLQPLVLKLTLHTNPEFQPVRD